MKSYKVQRPVMLNEVLSLIASTVTSIEVKSKFSIVDLTLGDAGHSFPIYKLIKEKELPVDLVSIDWDRSSISYVKKTYAENIRRVLECSTGCDEVRVHEFRSNSNWDIVLSNFLWVDKLYSFMNYPKAKIILADLGVSARQLLSKKRGFSFRDTGILDMRMAPDFQNVRAVDILNAFSKRELRTMLINTIGMPKSIASMVARELVHTRETKPFGFEDDIKRIRNIGRKLKEKGIRLFNKPNLDPSTLILLALRIAVNTELKNLFDLWANLKSIIELNGLVLIIAFHSGEWEILETVPPLYGFRLIKVIGVSSQEAKINPRARSAKLFVFKYAES